MSRPGLLDICIDQGADYALQATCIDSTGTPVDLTGCSATARLADGPGGTHDYAFIVTIPTGSDGVVTVAAPAADTAMFSFWRGLWNLDVTRTDGSVVRILQGNATLRRAAP